MTTDDRAALTTLILGRAAPAAADAILASDWLAARDKVIGERIAVAIEALTDGHRDNALGEAYHHGKRDAARIARADALTVQPGIPDSHERAGMER